ncbi:MAG TPA: hypothetical protein VN207_01660, partial [Ktedonobacteraceae bacterium]|nr:hypothetical protein [Ktedonobacteraceae bacterium]
ILLSLAESSNNIRYGALNSMIHDLLDEDPVYLAIMQKGVQEGREEGLQSQQQTAITLVMAGFPDLEMLARTKITAIADMKRLQQLILDLYMSRTREEVERVLLSLGE